MSHEKYSDLFENMTKDMLLRRLKRLDKSAPRDDEFGNELEYANWRGCRNVLIEKDYSGHTERQAKHNIDQFYDDVLEKISNGSAIGRVRDAGYLAFTVTPHMLYSVKRSSFPVSLRVGYGWNERSIKFKNITELKDYLKYHSNAIEKTIYDKHHQPIGFVDIKDQHLYQKMPKKRPKKYQAIKPVYDWYVINDCHC